MGIASRLLLLDTHAFLWWLAGDAAISATAREEIEDDINTIFVSAAPAWEITTKHRIGKLPDIAGLIADFDGVVTEQGFFGLPISLRHAQVAGALPGPHRDPFDRMLVAQVMLDHMSPVSNERLFDSYRVSRLW